MDKYKFQKGIKVICTKVLHHHDKSPMIGKEYNIYSEPICWNDTKYGFIDDSNTVWISAQECELVSEVPDFKLADYNIKRDMTYVNEMQKKFINADTQVLIETGYLTTSLMLTEKGVAARDAILFDSAHEAMVKLARAEIAEAKKK